MVHYSCDLCGKKIEDQRFVVQVEVFPVMSAEDAALDEADRDNLSELSDIISNLDQTGELELDASDPQAFRFDLCVSCQKSFRKDPLGRHRGRFRFSEN